jgi:hypothetical protein
LIELGRLPLANSDLIGLNFIFGISILSLKDPKELPLLEAMT